MSDEIMALFGAPRAHENDPERALRAALEMRRVLAAFNAERHSPLAIHFGVNTGLVYAGGVGGAGRKDYSVMGDAVNVAAFGWSRFRRRLSTRLRCPGSPAIRGPTGGRGILLHPDTGSVPVPHPRTPGQVVGPPLSRHPQAGHRGLLNRATG
jgi:hypothetical protein